MSKKVNPSTDPVVRAADKVIAAAKRVKRGEVEPMEVVRAANDLVRTQRAHGPAGQQVQP